MSQHTYTRARKIQIQDVKGSVNGLFPEEEKPADSPPAPSQKRGLLPARFTFRDRKGKNDRRGKHPEYYQPNEENLFSRLFTSLKLIITTTRTMYRSDGNISSVWGYFHRITNHIRTGRTVRAIQYKLHTSIFDKKFEGLLFKSTKTLTRGAAHRSEVKDAGQPLEVNSVSVHLLQIILSNLPDKLKYFYFMDFGADTGRNILVASCYPFKKILGFAQTPELRDISRLNLAHFPRSLMKCRDVDSRLLKETKLDIPNHNSIFLFHGQLDIVPVQNMIENITQSYKDNPRRLYLIFIECPQSEKVDSLIKKNHVFEPYQMAAVQGLRCRWLNPYKVNIYRTVYQKRDPLTDA